MQFRVMLGVLHLCEYRTYANKANTNIAALCSLVLCLYCFVSTILPTAWHPILAPHLFLASCVLFLLSFQGWIASFGVDALSIFLPGPLCCKPQASRRSSPPPLLSQVQRGSGCTTPKERIGVSHSHHTQFVRGAHHLIGRMVGLQAWFQVWLPGWRDVMMHAKPVHTIWTQMFTNQILKSIFPAGNPRNYSAIHLWGRSGRGHCRKFSANFRKLSAEFPHPFLTQ